MNAAATACRHARRALFGAALFGCAVPALVLTGGLAIGVSGMGAVGDVQGGPLLVGLAVVAVVFSACPLLFARRPPTAAVAGVTIDEVGEPEVLALVWRAADAIGAARPDELLVTLGGDVALHRRRGRSVLAIGACWLTASPAAELTVAAAHALVLERAGAGSRTARLLDERLERAQALAESRWLRILWGPYLRCGVRLRERARALRSRAADAACAEVFGLDALDRHLRAAFRNERFAEYWTNDVEPCLEAGFAPPILAGWDALRAEPWFLDQLADDLAAARLTERSDAVGDRAGAAAAPPAETRGCDLRIAIGELERRLLAAIYPDSDPGALVGIAWDAVPRAVWLPRLRAHARLAEHVEPFRVGRLVDAVVAAAPPGAAASGWTGPIAAALAVALVDAGWVLEAPLGEPIELSHGELALRPAGLCADVAAGGVSVEEWAAFACDAGIGDVLVAPGDAESTELPWTGASAVPPSAPVRLTLEAAPGRARGTTFVALGVVLGLPSGLLLLFAASAAATLVAQLVVAALGAVVLAALAAWATIRLRVLYGTGTLIVTSEGVRIEHPGLLKEPFEIARSDVRGVFVDERLPSHARFPVSLTPYPVAGDPDAYLWVRGAEAVVPCLGAPSQDPNLLVLLEDPVLAPRVRVATPTSPLRGEALVGLMLCVGDAAAARAAFEPWGLTRVASYEDAGHVVRGFSEGATRSAASSSSE